MKNIYYLTLTFLIFTLSSISISAQCFDNGHSPFQDQGWLSCNTSIGPIPERGNNHWIMYDFGHVYAIDSLYFWNHNVWGETGMGAKAILLDYSTDKMNWNTVGPINIEKAPGSWKYTGTQGPSLGNVSARYVLLTIISTWSDDSGCAGLGEIKFSVGETVDVEEIASTEWNISPNPANERITIDLPEVSGVKGLTLYNAVGQKVTDLIIPAGNQLIYPVTHLKEGLYFLSITLEREVVTKSFVKGG